MICFKNVQCRVSSQGQSQFSACCWGRWCDIWGWIMRNGPEGVPWAVSTGWGPAFCPDHGFFPLQSCWCSSPWILYNVPPIVRFWGRKFLCKVFYQSLSLDTAYFFFIHFILPKLGAFSWIPDPSLPPESQVEANHMPCGPPPPLSFFPGFTSRFLLAERLKLLSFHPISIGLFLL